MRLTTAKISIHLTVQLVLVLTVLCTCISTDTQKGVYEHQNVCVQAATEEFKLVGNQDKVAEFIVKENPDVPVKKAKKIIKSVNKASKKYNVKPEVLVGLMHVESTFNDKSVSKKGSVGVMQIHTKTWMRRNPQKTDLPSVGIAKHISDLYNEDTNIHAGAYILRHYLDRAEKLGVKDPYKWAITRYNGGSTNSHYKKTMKSVDKLKKFTRGGKNA